MLQTHVKFSNIHMIIGIVGYGKLLAIKELFIVHISCELFFYIVKEIRYVKTQGKYRGENLKPLHR